MNILFLTDSLSLPRVNEEETVLKDYYHLNKIDNEMDWELAELKYQLKNK